MVNKSPRQNHLQQFVKLVIITLGVIINLCCNVEPVKYDLSITKDHFEEYSIFSQRIDPYNLPKPFDTPSANNPAKVVAIPPEIKLELPKGFKVSVFADHLRYPNFLTVAPNGDVFVSEADTNIITVLRDTNKDGVADFREVWANRDMGLRIPFGLTFHDNFLYVGNADSIVRFSYEPGQTKASKAAQFLTDFPPWQIMYLHTIAFAPDGKKMYAGISSSMNVGEEKDARNATIMEFNPDGTDAKIYATGLAAPTMLLFNPESKELWASCEERNEMGDDLPPDFFTSIKANGFYGWPYAYIGPNPDPAMEGKRMDLVAQTIIPDVLVQAHAGPRSAVFYTGTQFPEEYRGDAFIVLAGSGNRSKLAGYKVVRVRFLNGVPVGVPEDFMTGWVVDETKGEIWGKPTGLALAQDGALLVSDVVNHCIWRVSFTKK